MQLLEDYSIAVICMQCIQYLNDNIDQTSDQFFQIDKCQIACFGKTINSFSKNLKTEHLACLSFFLVKGIFEGRKLIILQIFQALMTTLQMFM